MTTTPTPTHETADVMAEEVKRLAVEFSKATVRVNLNANADTIEAMMKADNSLKGAIDRMRDALAEQVRQPLTEVQIAEACKATGASRLLVRIARAIERAHGITPAGTTEGGAA